MNMFLTVLRRSILTMMLFLSGAAFAAPILIVSSSATEVVAGTSFNIAINIDDVSDLFSYNVSLLYNPATVQFNSLTEGVFLGLGGSTFFISGIDDLVGKISFSGASLIGAIPGVSGSGNLLDFMFTGLAAGNAAFPVTDLLLLDSSLTDIAVSTRSALVQITDRSDGAIPVPSVLLLLLIGSVSLWAIGRIKQQKC